MDSLSSSSGARQRYSTESDESIAVRRPSARHGGARPGLPAMSKAPDTPDTGVSFSSFQRSQTRRDGRPENTGALSANPRIERQMQQLSIELDINARKLVALTNQADMGRNGARLAALRARRSTLMAQLKDCMRLLDPNQSGTVLESVKSHATRELEQTYLRVWEDYQRTVKSGYAKYAWTTLSGFVAYAIPFGTMTMLARGLEIVPLVMLAGPVHTLAEPLWAMVRATTWTNPASEAHIGRQRARARANGDAWRYLAGIPPKTKMLWIDPATGKRALLTAAQALATSQDLWLWLYKTLPDDLTFISFWVNYSIKNVLGDLYGPTLFDRRLATGKRNDLLAQYGAGLLSGAETALSCQAIRRRLAPSTGGIEVVTKRMHDWALQAGYLRSYARDITQMLAEGNLQPDAIRLLRAKLREVENDLRKATAKSSLPGSIAFEYSVMFQKKRLASGTDPDMPGKRLDTICSMLGKTTSLLPSLAATYLCQPLSQSPDRMTRMIAHVLVPFTLVIWPGFAMRAEYQDWYRSLFGACKGMASATRAGCCCNAPDPDDDAASAADSSDEESDMQAQSHAGADDMQSHRTQASASLSQDDRESSEPGDDSDSGSAA